MTKSLLVSLKRKKESNYHHVQTMRTTEAKSNFSLDFNALPIKLPEWYVPQEVKIEVTGDSIIKAPPNSLTPEEIRHRRLSKTYCYSLGLEPIAYILPSNLGWISINSYNCLVLNTRYLTTIDIDGTLSNGQPNTITVDRMLEVLRDGISDWALYKTFAGYRALIGTYLYPAHKKYQQLTEQLNGDYKYLAISRRQNLFRLRLTPKQWRLDEFYEPVCSLIAEGSSIAESSSTKGISTWTCSPYRSTLLREVHDYYTTIARPDLA